MGDRRRWARPAPDVRSRVRGGGAGAPLPAAFEVLGVRAGASSTRSPRPSPGLAAPPLTRMRLKSAFSLGGRLTDGILPVAGSGAAEGLRGGE